MLGLGAVILRRKRVRSSELEEKIWLEK